IADNEAEATKLVSKVFVGISAGMVLGVPIANLVANYGSFQLVMLTFAAVNVVIGIACAVYLPAFIEVSSVSFRQQMQALIQFPTIISMVTIICLNGAVFGFYSYLSDFLSKASSVSSLLISFLLLIYGLANVLGNEVAGRLLASIPQKILLVLPILMIVPYLLLYLCHQNLILIFFLIMVIGVFSGMTQNLNQYIMNDTLASTPDLANGLFITGANLGTTLGSMVCGQFIIRWGTVSSLFATIFFLIMGIVVIWIQKLLIKF
ncbi:MFS transporter, partial [Lactobacillus sp. XV13L]|nr:MFS transporter [Lactobacillus sp. XV13L]